MHLIKPEYLAHKGDLKDFEVYSCDVSPDGSRLATAGGDGYVRIWSTEAIRNSQNPDYEKLPQLAAVSNHSGTIHAVRFSPNGRYLASGADDKIVCIYALDPNAPSHAAFGSNETAPQENWRVIRRLVGHDNDVQDIGWSFDSSILVSVGLDSKVVVWSGHSFEKLKTLSNHQSHVKGITFDPANKYFATASDDRTIKVYRFNSPPANATQQDQVNNFVLEHTITAPFQTSPLTTYFRRCSWSPDGAHIAAANATNGPVSSVAILSRGTWDGEISLVGHEGPVEVTCFSPRLFYRDPPKADQDPNAFQPTVTIVACAGQDKCLSIWNTSFPRPFMISQELAGKSISDLAWSPEGETLFVTSLDGSIVSLVFEPGELGYPAPIAENEKALSKFGAGRRAGIIEGPEAYFLEESSKSGELKGVQGRMGALMGDGGAVQPPTITNGTNGVSATTTTQTNGSTTAAQTPAAPAAPAADQRVEKLKQRVTVTKDGKKRIAPMLVSSSSGVGTSSLPQTQLLAATTTSSGRADNPHNILDLSKPYDGFPKGGLATLLVGNKRRFADLEGDDDRQIEQRLAADVQPGGASIVLNSEKGLIPPSASDGKPLRSEETAKVLRPAIVNAALSVSQVRLAVPKIRSVIVRTMDGSEPPQNGVDTNTGKAAISDTVILEARNTTGSRIGSAVYRDPTRISCTSKGQLLWQDFLPKSALIVTGNPNFFAAACEDGSLYVWSPAGRRTVSAMVIESQACIMDCRGWYLMCISAVGMCYVWNIKTMAAAHQPISLAPILDIAAYAQGPHITRSPGIVFARLNSAGRMVVAMSNGEGFTYNPDMCIWQRISEAWWGVASQYWNTTDASVGNIRSSKDKTPTVEKDDEVSIENISAGIIPTLERNTTNQCLLQGRAFHLQRLMKALISAEGFEALESSASIAHLENRVAAARTLGAREEFKIYLTMYIKRLGAEGMKGKIEELLRSISGGLVEDDEDEDSKDEDLICGWKKEDLLKEAVLILGKHRDLQRITVPYARLLGIIDGHSRRDEQAMITDM